MTNRVTQEDDLFDLLDSIFTPKRKLVGSPLSGMDKFIVTEYNGKSELFCLLDEPVEDYSCGKQEITEVACFCYAYHDKPVFCGSAMLPIYVMYWQLEWTDTPDGCRASYLIDSPVRVEDRDLLYSPKQKELFGY